jgi:hypothetical protein
MTRAAPRPDRGGEGEGGAEAKEMAHKKVSETASDEMPDSPAPSYRTICRWVFAAGAICCSTSVLFINVGNTTRYMLWAGIAMVVTASLTKPFGKL